MSVCYLIEFITNRSFYTILFNILHFFFFFSNDDADVSQWPHILGIKYYKLIDYLETQFYEQNVFMLVGLFVCLFSNRRFALRRSAVDSHGCSLSGWQVGSPWCFCRVPSPMNHRRAKLTWSTASRWLWRGARRDCAAGSPAWPRRCGSRCASAWWSVATSSGTSAGTAAWTAEEASWREASWIRHSISC